MDERRQLPRWKIKKETKVWMQGEPSNARHCIIEDMHLKGMCVSFNEQLPQQQSVRMSFALSDNFDLIKIEAEIPWAKEDQGRYVYGMFFNKIIDSDKDRIYQYISSHCSQQLKDKWWAA